MKTAIFAVLLAVTSMTNATEVQDRTEAEEAKIAGNLWQCYPRVCHEPREVDSAPKSDINTADTTVEQVAAFFWNDFSAVS